MREITRAKKTRVSRSKGPAPDLLCDSLAERDRRHVVTPPIKIFSVIDLIVMGLILCSLIELMEAVFMTIIQYFHVQAVVRANAKSSARSLSLLFSSTS